MAVACEEALFVTENIIIKANYYGKRQLISIWILGEILEEYHGISSYVWQTTIVLNIFGGRKFITINSVLITVAIVT